jgi:hypothetical protein
MTFDKIPRSPKLALFVFLSLADLLLTWGLVRNGDGVVYESNPVARWLLTGYGWLGLTAFKLAAVVLVVGLARVISRRRPRTGDCVLSFACAALTLVVAYSTSLAGVMNVCPRCRQVKEGSPAEQTSLSLDAKLNRSREYRTLLVGLRDDLAARRCTLADAVNQLYQSEQGKDFYWRRALRLHYPGRTDEECLASSVLEVVRMTLPDDSPETARIETGLEAEFRATYGRSPRKN